MYLMKFKIPYGKTASYKYIAKKIDNSMAYRAVANANAHNPIPIIIPCHRVILKMAPLVITEAEKIKTKIN